MGEYTENNGKVLKIINQEQKEKMLQQRTFVKKIGKLKKLKGKEALIAQTVTLVFEDVLEEFDLAEEAKHYKEGLDVLAHIQKHIPNPEKCIFKVPTIYLSSQDFIVMDDIRGQNRKDNIVKMNSFLEDSAIPIEDRKMVFQALVTAFGHMVLVEGFFHCDPHGGNLYVISRDGVYTIWIIDWGGIAKLSENSRRQINALVLAQEKKEKVRILESIENAKGEKVTFEENVKLDDKYEFACALTSTSCHSMSFDGEENENKLTTRTKAATKENTKKGDEEAFPRNLPKWMIHLLRVLSCLGGYARKLGSDLGDIHSDAIWFRLATNPPPRKRQISAEEEQPRPSKKPRTEAKKGKKDKGKKEKKKNKDKASSFSSSSSSKKTSKEKKSKTKSSSLKKKSKKRSASSSSSSSSSSSFNLFGNLNLVDKALNRALDWTDRLPGFD